MYDEIIQKLADMFFVSVEYVQAHFWEYVLMYGKYHFWKSTPVATILFAMFVTLLVVLVGLLADVEPLYDGGKEAVKFIVISFSLCFVAIALLSSLPYIMSPEMYSLEAVMRLMNGG